MVRMIQRVPDHHIKAAYWERERAVGEKIIATADIQLGKIANEQQLRIDYAPGLPECVVIPFPARVVPPDLAA